MKTLRDLAEILKVEFQLTNKELDRHVFNPYSLAPTFYPGHYEPHYQIISDDQFEPIRLSRSQALGNPEAEFVDPLDTEITPRFASMILNNILYSKNKQRLRWRSEVPRHKLAIIKYLVENFPIFDPLEPGLVTRRDREYPLMIAVSKRCLDVVEYFISLKNNEGQPLFDLSINGYELLRFAANHFEPNESLDFKIFRLIVEKLKKNGLKDIPHSLREDRNVVAMFNRWHNAVSEEKMIYYAILKLMEESGNPQYITNRIWEFYGRFVEHRNYLRLRDVVKGRKFSTMLISQKFQEMRNDYYHLSEMIWDFHSEFSAERKSHIRNRDQILFDRDIEIEKNHLEDRVYKVLKDNILHKVPVVSFPQFNAHINIYNIEKDQDKKEPKAITYYSSSKLKE